jgi:ribose transport system permease protein
LAIGVGIGLVNGFIVVFLGIDSLIATLGTGSIIGAITIGVSGNETIVKNVGGSFATDVAGRSWANISEPVLFMLVVMVIVGLLLEQTVAGRYWYAIGFDLDVTRLAGVRVRALRVMAFVIAATIASIAGITLAARIGASSPGEGPDYLLPAFAAAFLGATQFRNGRFNAWGAIVATLLLGTGDYGILLVGGPTWAPEVFEGVVLIAAVGVTEIGKRRAGAGKWTGMPAWWARYFTLRRGNP